MRTAKSNPVTSHLFSYRRRSEGELGTAAHGTPPRIDSKALLTAETGATIPDYLIVVIIFIGIAIAATLSIGQLSQGFHAQMTGGFDQAYPTNFIPPPNPSPTPTP